MVIVKIILKNHSWFMPKFAEIKQKSEKKKILKCLSTLFILEFPQYIDNSHPPKERKYFNAESQDIYYLPLCCYFDR